MAGIAQDIVQNEQGLFSVVVAIGKIFQTIYDFNDTIS